MPRNGEEEMKYLVTATEGPAFASPAETAYLLKKIILPGFDAVMKLESEKKILAGGLPVGDRALVFIIEAASHEELDKLLRGLPFWPVLEWDVTALQTFEGRAAQDRQFVHDFKEASEI